MYANSQLLITPKDLSSLLGEAGAKRPLMLDLRPPEPTRAGHIPGAIHLDLWGVSLIDTDPAPLKAFMWMIEHVLAMHGVDARRRRLSSTTSSPASAPRARSGSSSTSAIRRVRLLDGGFGAWTRAGLPVTRDAAPPPKSEWTGTPQERHASPPGATSRTRSASADAVILDTRSDGEYCGTTVRATRGGAIPGAVHIEWTRNLAPDGAFKPAAELRTMYEDAGVTPDREVITYCQGGYRAAHSYLALRLLGYPRVRNYVGSWKEWGDREDLPIEDARTD